MACALITTSNAALAVFSNLVIPASSAIVEVNADANSTLSFEPAIELINPVQGVDLSGPVGFSFNVSGANNDSGLTGSNSSGWDLALPNSGVTTVSFQVQGTLTAQAKAGAYQVQVDFTCL